MTKVEQLSALMACLTERDRTVCHLLWEHRIMTTTQLSEVAFDGRLDRAKHRLVTLLRLDLLRGFRPLVDLGGDSSPYHYVLGEMGIEVVAAARGIPPRQLAYRVEDGLQLAHSQRLQHIVGINDVYADLVAGARRQPAGAALTKWWSEWRCAEHWGAVVGPDAYGRWREAGIEGDFFLEYDRGTEATGQLARKVADYATLAEGTELITPVLVWLPSTRREAEVRRALDAARSRDVPILTGHGAGDQGPVGAVWLPLGGERRMTLRALVLSHPRREAAADSR